MLEKEVCHNQGSNSQPPGHESIRAGTHFSFFSNFCHASCTEKNLTAFPSDKFKDSSKLKEFADDNFKFDENGYKTL